MVFHRTFGRISRKRRSMGRRRFARRRRFTRRPMTSGKVLRLIDAELKFHDINIKQVNAPSSEGLIVNLSDIQQGDGFNERIGNWIKPVALMGTVTVQGDPAADDPLSQFRVSIVQWRENQDVDDISLIKLVQNVVQPYQQYNVQSKGAFKILWSWVGNVVNNDDNP